MIRMRAGGQLRQIKRMRIMRGGSLVQVRRARIVTGSEAVVIFLGADPMSVTVNPDSIYRVSALNSLSAAVAANVTGGRGPYQYLWVSTSYEGRGLVLAGSTSANCNFSISNLGSGEEASGEFSVTVTDADAKSSAASGQYYFLKRN